MTSDGGSIGGLLFAKQYLQPGERVIWRRFANRTQSWRGVGGCLFLTNQRLPVSPHVVERLFGGQTVEIHLSDVVAVEKELKSETGGWFDGSLFRDRLRVDLRRDQRELFVVNKLDSAIPRLRQATTHV